MKVTAMSAETMEGLQQMTRLKPESQSYTMFKTDNLACNVKNKMQISQAPVCTDSK
jgi:hypothetical protein